MFQITKNRTRKRSHHSNRKLEMLLVVHGSWQAAAAAAAVGSWISKSRVVVFSFLYAVDVLHYTSLLLWLCCLAVVAVLVHASAMRRSTRRRRTSQKLSWLYQENHFRDSTPPSRNTHAIGVHKVTWLFPTILSMYLFKK